MNLLFEHRGVPVEIEYSSVDHLLVVTMHFAEKDFAFGDASSVDELLELLDDLIATHEAYETDQATGRTDPRDDHERAALAKPMSAQQIAELREAINRIADEYDEQNRPWMEHKGYRAIVRYLPDEQLIAAQTEGMPELRCKSLKSLRHRFQVMIDEHLEAAASQL
jgi:hypothetical protein